MADQGERGMSVALGVVSGLGMALASWLVLAPQVGPPPIIPFQDKIFHALAFACLTAPAVLVLPRRYLWFWVAHMAALGAGIELAQARGGDGRSGDVLDFAADVVGIAVAQGLGRWLKRQFDRDAEG